MTGGGRESRRGTGESTLTGRVRKTSQRGGLELRLSDEGRHRLRLGGGAYKQNTSSTETLRGGRAYQF